ncbi:MAG: hypothetical protein WC897_01220 [Candidatus Gracilibacteria bacterium]
MTERHKIFAGLTILLATALMAGWQFIVLQNTKADASLLTKTSSELSNLSRSLTEEYQTIKVDVSKYKETSMQELALVFPEDENLTSLTRLFDEFAVKNNFATNPFFISELKYGDFGTPEGENYRILPVDMTITTSSKNLDKFLEYIETSGSLEGGVRMMSAQNVDVTYPSEYGGTYEVKIELNAYFAQEI